ncbi:MAG: C-GCAxxG-C-C family protein [Desulfatibacillaceae bacterium]|nr:C-GCAxxG-C-C family protein [Desulfatibacillaceae bacterium]
MTQDLTRQVDDTLLQAATGLEGGLAANGSTCGVLTGGSLGLAQALAEQVEEAGPAGETAGLAAVGGYVRHIRKSYGFDLCRQRTGVDFYTPAGQVRYFLGPDKIALCMNHISGAIRYLDDASKKGLSHDDIAKAPVVELGLCARKVLEAVRRRTGAGDARLERLSYIYDGGLGLSGGVCGAAVGAILAINLVLGTNLRHVAYLRTFKPFLAGHFNILKKNSPKRVEPFSAGSIITKALKNQAGALECRAITGKEFEGPQQFAGFMAGGPCNAHIDLCIENACRILEQAKKQA